MAPVDVKTVVKKEEPTLKNGNVGKLTTEVRRKVPEEIKVTSTVKKNYYVNKAKQANKIVLKNKTAAPVRIEPHPNDVYISYSPAVFKEAVIEVIGHMKENVTFETDKMIIKVTKVMPSVDLKNIKTQDLITMEVQAKNKNEKPVKLQVHVYYTSQAVMVQGHRKVGGIKGFKLFVENFFQPCVETAMTNRKEEIKDTKVMLDKAELEKKEQVIVPNNEGKSEDKFHKKAEQVAVTIVEELVKEASTSTKESNSESVIQCDKCEGQFTIREKFIEHMERNHTNKNKEFP